MPASSADIRTGDRGGATVWTLAAGLLAVLVAGAVASAGAAVVARHRAQSAADLAALAGALYASEGAEAACGRARFVASANAARLTSCWVDGLDVTVTTETIPTGPAALAGAAHGSARAGPS